MNYRHIYHAGNFADCLKHIVLCRILDYLKKKDKPFFSLDTHAGIGLYDLSAEEAQKTGEWQDGIGRLVSSGETSIPPHLAPILSSYLGAIRSLNPDGGLNLYPGSPKLIQMLSREQDRATFVEMHASDVEELSASCRHDRRCHVRRDDGWVALRADLPPKERRGLVLIDPPYEEAGEYDRMVSQWLKGYKRWPTGTYCLWYPIKAQREADRMAEQFAEAGIENSLRAELIIHKLDTAKRLNGTGLIIINPPFTLHDELQQLLPFLADRLGQSAWRSHLDWIRPPR